MGQDPFLASFVRSEVLKKVIQVRLICIYVSLQMLHAHCLCVYVFISEEFPLLSPVLNTVCLLCLYWVPLEITCLYEDIRPNINLLPVCDLSAG